MNRYERILESYKADNERLREAVAQVPDWQLIPLCAAYRSRSGVELFKALDDIFTAYWKETAEEEAAESEAAEEAEKRHTYRRVVELL